MEVKKSQATFAVELADIELERRSQRQGRKEKLRQDLKDHDKQTRVLLSAKRQEFDAWMRSKKTAAAASA